MSSRINLCLHLLSFATYAGATLAVTLILTALASTEKELAVRHRIAARVMQVYDPLVIAALGVLVMTGAFSLTSYKAALRGAFFERVGGPLLWKLGLTFILINLAAYMAFGIGHRIVRSLELAPPHQGWLDDLLRRFRASAVIALLLTAAITWLALRLAQAASPIP